jgi:hypothetical protein
MMGCDVWIKEKYMHLSLRKGIGLLAIPSALLLTASSSLAAGSSPTLFGNASFNSSGLQLASVGLYPDPTYFAGVDFSMPSGTLLSSITTLAADFQMTTNDCAGGSPRFVAFLANNQSVEFDLGPYPSYTGCGALRQLTGNLTQVPVNGFGVGLGPYESWTDILGAAGSQQVTDIALIVDSSWKFPPNNEQVAEIYSVTINGTTYNFAPPTTKDQCKNGGWANFTNPGTFKNQGDCVSFVATGGKNGPSG